MEFGVAELLDFVDNVYDAEMSRNAGGMRAPDMFSLYHCLRRVQPTLVIESGVWNGQSTKLIRKTLPRCRIVCLDPRPVPADCRDRDANTTYRVGREFVDFGALDASICAGERTLAFFDDHQNAVQRLEQAHAKGIRHLLFNDNYPVGCGSHFTLEHLLRGDSRHGDCRGRDAVARLLRQYVIYPNVFAGRIPTGEGEFACSALLESAAAPAEPRLAVFAQDRASYRWNTYVELGSA